MPIFVNGVGQDVDPRDGTLVVGEAKTGETFYAGAVAKKTADGTKTLAPASEIVAAGYYAATTLSAVDADLTAANVADGVTIFGITGTLVSGTLAEDVLGSDDTALLGDSTATFGYNEITLIADEEDVLATKTLTFDANSMQVIIGFASLHVSAQTCIKLRLYADGVMVAESASLPAMTHQNRIIEATAELSGEKTCELRIHNYDTSSHTYYGITDDSGVVLPFGIGVGSIKV